MKVDDPILYVAERGAEPRRGRVVATLGAIWVDVELDDGERVDHVFSATNHFQSPRGNYCVSGGSSVEPPSREDRYITELSSD